MKKVGKITIGGIQQKIFNLVLIMLILVMASYSAVILYQINGMNRLVDETNQQQKEAITSISGSTMDAVISGTFGRSTRMEARIADDMFSDTADAVKVIADYTKKIFEDPESFPGGKVNEPDAALDGEISVQLLKDEGVDMNDSAAAEKAALLGNLSGLMTALYANAEVDSCYVAVPEGIMVLVDDHSSSKFDENGQVIPIPVRERDWYKGAVKSGGLYFTDVASDLFTGQVCIMCSIPVYAHGQLAAVVGADLFLDNMKEYVDASDESGSFVCIVNDSGHVVFSPEKEGVFRVRDEAEEEDLRETDNDSLASFIGSALMGPTKVATVEADNTVYYLSGAPVDTVGWAVVSAVRKDVTDQPTVMMEEQYDAILGDAVSSYKQKLERSRMTIMVLLLAVTILALAGALVVSGRIVRPLEIMTRRVTAISGENLQFKMADPYRTGDEIEALAESFAELSARTLRYVDEVKTVTAEKERIGTELNMATAIQESQLPRLFPAFPNRPEFDVYATMSPAREVGGDFYDFFLVDDDHIGLVISDVSGKGVPAALFMMVSRVLIKSHLQNGETPGEALENVNDQLCDGNEANYFVTVWAAVLEISTGRGLAVNAGHEHPAIRRKDGNFELSVYRHSPALALLEGISFPQHEFEMYPGDSLFVYTDGVAEATNADDELFGTNRMLEALNRDPKASPEEVLANVKAGIKEFVAGAEQFDDITMLCIEYKGKA